MKKKVKKYKLKIKSSAKKRFKITGTGKVKRRNVGMRHLLEHKSPSKKRGKRLDNDVAKSDMKKIKKMMPGIV
ncbi:50S ribosomal protein L35 [Candidatus Marinamargulisbacteria bacterium SCGC AG-439-L15]|nr:50S ribosomal protein L35 [Candidatus Marinamargulisbacteria bacterium SCGC AG-439-L15]